MYYAYLDESGNTAPFQPTERFLVIIALVASDRVARRLALHLKRVKTWGHIRGSEIKAKEASPRLRMRLLNAISSEDATIIALAFDKATVTRVPEDHEIWYRDLAAEIVYHCARRWPHLHLMMDKRYTNERLREALTEAIHHRLADVDCHVLIEHADSHANPGLQIADFVAWAVRAKYEGQQSQYLDVVRNRIIWEQIITAK